MSVSRRNLIKVCGFAITGVALAACQTSSTTIGGPNLQHGSIQPPAYQLDTGDRLRVIVFGQDDLSNIYTIDDTGAISMPLIGAVNARGRSPDQLETQIATQLRAGFLRNPNVSIEVDTYRPFFILGEVQSPGQYSYVTGMTMREALAIAGGVTERGSKRRAILTRKVNGEPTRTRIDPEYAIMPGDTIEVVERLF